MLVRASLGGAALSYQRSVYIGASLINLGRAPNRDSAFYGRLSYRSPINLDLRQVGLHLGVMLSTKDFFTSKPD